MERELECEREDITNILSPPIYFSSQIIELGEPTFPGRNPDPGATGSLIESLTWSNQQDARSWPIFQS